MPIKPPTPSKPEENQTPAPAPAPTTEYAQRAVFVGVGRDRAGNEQPDGQIWCLFQVHDYELYFDKEGNYIFPYKKLPNGELKRLTRLEVRKLPNYGSTKFVECKLGAIVPLPFYNAGLMDTIIAEGKFAKEEFAERINQMYADGLTAREVYDALEAADGLLSKPALEQPKA